MGQRSILSFIVALTLGPLAVGCSDCPPGGNAGSLFCHGSGGDAGRDAGSDAGSLVPDAGSRCRTNGDCASTPATPICDPSTGSCVACEMNADCHDPARPECELATHTCGCVPGFCVDPSRPMCDVAMATCGCGVDTDCTDPTRPVCDLPTHTCGCGASADCAGTPATPVCDTTRRVCVHECMASTDCHDPLRPVCDATTDTCVACVTSTDCHDPTRPVCDVAAHTCGCGVSSDCTGTPATPLCDASTHHCTMGCDTRADCIDPARPACDTSAHMCVPCVASSDCTDPTLPVCDTTAHTCVRCVATTDCPLTDVCSSTHTCVPGCTDSSHCGAETCCAMSCRDLTTDVMNCGTCGHVCALAHATASCTASACAIAHCDPGFADCDGMAADGCEVDTTSTPTHCGSCATSCMLAHATAGCAASACTITTCDPGFGDCDTLPGTGCETPLTTSTDCGTCGHACTAPTSVCIGGTCMMPAGCNGAAYGIPWAGTMADGTSVTAYSTSLPTGACSAVAQTRTCSGGVISGTFTNQTCQSGCALPWGGSVTSGTAVTGWLHASEHSPTLCMSNRQTCTNGSLPLGSYTNASCDQLCATYTGTNTVCNLYTWSGQANYGFRSGWCVTPACTGGYWNTGSTYMSSFCTNDHGDGTCTAPDDVWTVTCSPYDVEGTWNCDGTTCSPTAYDASCTGHW